MDYDKQAADFLARFGLTLTVKHASAKLPPWREHDAARRYAVDLTEDQHWRVTVSRADDRRARLSFDFFNSIHDTWAGIDLRPYSVLACLSSDAGYANETPDDLARDLGGDPDSRRDYAQAKAAIAFAKRIAHFFTDAELEALQEIQ